MSKEISSGRIIQFKIIEKELCELNENMFFIFGDNLVGKGTAGQACIRYCENSIGIPTKRLPTMDEKGFFTDTKEECLKVKESLDIIEKLLKEGKLIGFPVDGIGTGLAKMEEKAPKTFKYMTNRLNKMLEKYELKKDLVEEIIEYFEGEII